MPSSSHIVVNYHRLLSDYDSFQLAVFAPSASPTPSYHLFSQPRRHALTSFGAVFRFSLSDLGPESPPHLNLLPIHASFHRPDAPARLLTLHSIDPDSPAVHHFFIAQYSSAVHTSPHHFARPAAPPRFLFLVLDRPEPPATCSPPAPPPPLTVWSSPTPTIAREAPPQFPVFPATPMYRPHSAPSLYLLDRLAFPPDTLVLFVAARPLANLALSHPLLPPDCERPSLHLRDVATRSAFSASLDHASNAVSLAPYTPGDTSTSVPFLLATQSETAAALSPQVVKISSPPPVLLDTRADPPQVLRTPSNQTAILTVYHYATADGTTQSAEPAAEAHSMPEGSDPISVTPVDKYVRVPTILVDAKPYRSARVFYVDLSALSPDALAAGLHISAPQVDPLLWTPDLGMQVVVTSSAAQLLGPLDVDVRLFYHRFDNLTDWPHWALHVSTDPVPDASDSAAPDEESGEQQQTSTPQKPVSVVLRPCRPTQHGVVLFDLSDLAHVRDRNLNFDLVRMHDPVPHDVHPDMLNDPVFRDVRRHVTLSTARGELHVVQGDTAVLSTAPDRAALMQGRHIQVRYRRFLPSDYDGWDLWTWDLENPIHRHVAVAPADPPTSQAWAEFSIDRAKFGGGATLFLLPRQGGEQWIGKDDPVRRWVASEMLPRFDDALRDGLVAAESGPAQSVSNVPTFYIAQQSDVMYTSRRDLAATAFAEVTANNAVTIRTSVPIPWVSLQIGQEHHRLEVSITHQPIVFKKLERRFSEVNDPQHTNGCTLPFIRSKELSPVERVYEFLDNVVIFDENYPIEMVSVKVQGFNAVQLKWKRQQNWDNYHYKGALGWQYRSDQCVFRCFAPTADSMQVILYDEPTGQAGRTAVAMRRIPEGCWKAIVESDLKGKYYKLLALGENKQLFPGVEVIDPYSRCNTSHTGRGLIFGKECTKIHPRPDVKPSEAIVYELHIRDVTIGEESGVSLRGKFMGLTENGTHMKRPLEKPERVPLTPWEPEELPGVLPTHRHLDKYSTGLDHIAQMGVTAIQILPIQDFDNDESDEKSYRWGYMPVHFNSPDGWYATETTTVARVTEFKLLVDAIHKAGMKVIMDVVYNHTAEDSNEFNLGARFSFNGIVPRYYYRTCGNTPVAHNGDSTCGKRRPDESRCGECYSNGSGCGNEFRSESPMGRKFIVDSLKYWATEYKVDGFRFDLLGLIDVDTLAQASTELRKIDPKIMVYGEPWCGGLSPIQTTEKGMQRSKGFGVFNNSFRDAIRGSPFDSEETFVMDGGRLDQIKAGIIGSVDDFCDDPLETINYVECHDNYTLWDHMRFYIRERSNVVTYTLDDMRRMHKLAALIVFMSQGVPFMQVGQEMCRTKYDIENSYESPDHVNMIRWNTKVTEWSVVQYYRGLILLRRAHPEIFSKETAAEIRESVTFYEDLGLSVPERCIAYQILGDRRKLLQRLKKTKANEPRSKLEDMSDQWSQVVVLLNPTPLAVMFPLPGGDENKLWYQVVDAIKSGERDLRGPAIGLIEVEGRSGAVFRMASKKDTTNAQLRLRLDCVSDSYSSFQGDDILSRYAVGLDKDISPEEARLREEIKIRRTNPDGSSDGRSRSGRTSSTSLQSLHSNTTTPPSRILRNDPTTHPGRPLKFSASPPSTRMPRIDDAGAESASATVASATVTSSTVTAERDKTAPPLADKQLQ